MRHTVVSHYYTVPKFADVEGRGVGGSPEWEFMNTILPKDSSLLHYAIHSCSNWRIFLPCMVFSDLREKDSSRLEFLHE
jgi:hypothetical protein